MSKVYFSKFDFHPALQDCMGREMERLEKFYPPYDWMEVGVRVITPPEFPKDQMKKLGYAMTSTKGEEAIIYMNPFLFGPTGDLEELRKRVKGDKVNFFHGSVEDLRFFLTHEYGHVLEQMLRVRGVKEPSFVDVIEAKFDEFVQYYADGKPAVGQFVEFVSMLTGVKNALPKKTLQYFGTGYALESFGEFFAEAFALTAYGNEEEKAGKPAQMMKELLKIAGFVEA